MRTTRSPTSTTSGRGRAFRKIRNLSDSEDAVYVVVGGKDGYVGRDGKVPGGEHPDGRAFPTPGGPADPDGSPAASGS